jgi:hypothetical protein
MSIARAHTVRPSSARQDAQDVHIKNVYSMFIYQNIYFLLQ